MAERLDDLLFELFARKGFADKLTQRRFFSQLSLCQDVPLAKTQMIKMLVKAAKREEYAINTVQLAEYMMIINDCDSMEVFVSHAEEIMKAVFSAEPQHKYMDCVEKVIDYVGEHLSDSNLSLKWIAENYLYMNADYVSKQFVRETGCKFSYYLTNLRIQEAKKLLLSDEGEALYWVAEKVGFGNNPQYFSQIFKKYTQMSPRAYVKKMLEK